MRVYNKKRLTFDTFVHKNLTNKAKILDICFALKGKYILTIGEIEENLNYVVFLWHHEKIELLSEFQVKEKID